MMNRDFFKGLTDAEWKSCLLLVISGVLTGFTLVFPQVGFLEWLTIVPAAIFVLSRIDADEYRARKIYGYGLLFFLSLYVVVFHWFVNMYPLDFIDGMTPLAAIAVVLSGCIGLSLFQAVFGGLAFLLLRVLFRTRALRSHRILRPFAAAAVWAVYEWTQTLGWWGVPWARLPIGQSEYIVGLQTASLLGPYIITFAIVLVNFCVAYVLLEGKGLKAMSVTVAATLIFQYGVGTVLYLLPQDGTETVRIAAVQGNISSNEKWDESGDQENRTLRVYAEHTLEAAKNGADIVIWPETALPYSVTESNFYGRYCSAVAKEGGVTVLAGVLKDNGSRNAIVCVHADGSFHDTVYYKQRLVPFGEFVPFKEVFELIIPPLADLVMTSGDMIAGEGSEVMELDGVKVGCLICFDSIYEGLARQSVRDGANIICLSTNDSWFTDSRALYMHNAQAQLRAIENGRYVVRAANTGISTVISSKGEVLRELEPLVDGIVEYDVPVNTHRTLYSVIGNAFIVLLVAIFVLLILWDVVMSKKKKSTKAVVENDEIEH